MKFLTTITFEMKLAEWVMLTGIIAATLIALPMGVFAQTASESNGDQASTTSATEAVPEAQPYYDNYKHEKLPKSGIEFNDFVVGPGRFSLEIAPGETKTVNMNISNRLGERRLFQFTTEDMTNNTDGDSVIKLLGDEVGPYTIKDYITVPYKQFYIENNERAVVPVTISIPADAEPGGFYGSILTEVLPVVTTSSDSDVVPTTALVSRIGTLFFVTTPGDIERSGSFLDFSTIPDKKIYLEGPIDMGLVYENTGTTHITPYGDITVTNMLGDIVGQVELVPWFVMPNSVRTKEVSWNREFLFGRYTVTADIERGYEDVVDTKSLVFWVFPWKILVTVFVSVFAFFLVIRFAVRNFEFKRK
jgi:hypothetical protein